MCRSKEPPCAEDFSDYVATAVLPSNRDHGYYIADKDAYGKLYEHPRGENALHDRVVDHTNKTYPNVIIIS